MKIHFLNVGDGDCSVIQHKSGRVTVIDVNKAGCSKEHIEKFNQKDCPSDPISYLQNLKIRTIHRFVLTHPDMDHLGGVKKLFDEFEILNFWDTNNNKVINSWGGGSHSKEDWSFYQQLKKNLVSDVKRVCYFSGGNNCYFNKDDNGGEGDAIYILAPTEDIINETNKTENWNDCSYVLLVKFDDKKIIFAGDSDDTSWDFILKNHHYLVSDVDVLIAPHHGRDSGRKWDFLDVLKPKLVLIGNAPSENIAYVNYGKYSQTLTNNRSGDIILEKNGSYLNIYVKNKSYASGFKECRYSNENDAYYIGFIGMYCHLQVT